jgi:hypothetical protein
MSTSDLHDSTAQNDGVAALFLAESGIERASQLYSTGTACASVAPVAANFGRGSVQPTGVVPSVIPVPTRCRVQSQGRVGNTTRTIEVDLQRGPSLGDIAFLSTSSASANNTFVQWNHTIAAGAGPNRLVVVGVSIRGGATVISGTYNGVAMITAGNGGLPAGISNGVVRVEWLYAVNPPTGTRQIRVNLSVGARVVAGAFAFSGADLVTPVDTSASGTGNYPTNSPGVSVTPVTDKTWIVDVLALQPTKTATATPPQTNPAIWRTTTGGAAGIFGAGSYRGPVSPVATVSMSWAISAFPPGPGPYAWAHSVLALRPVPLVHIARWTEL